VRCSITASPQPTFAWRPPVSLVMGPPAQYKSMAFVVVEKVKWFEFQKSPNRYLRWTVPVAETVDAILDLVAMLIGTGGARTESLIVLHVHLPMLTGAMSRKAEWQTFSGEIPMAAVETDYDVRHEEGRPVLHKRGSPKSEVPDTAKATKAMLPVAAAEGNAPVPGGCPSPSGEEGRGCASTRMCKWF